IGKLQYSLGGPPRERIYDDAHFLAWTDEVLNSFRALENAVIARQSVTLTPEICRTQLQALADWGSITYLEFFDEDARETLAGRFALMEGIPTPTFRSDL